MPALPTALSSWLDAQPTETFATAATLIAPGAAPTHVWYLRSGLVRVFSLDRDGAEFNHDFIGDGGWVLGRIVLRDDEVCCADRAIGAAALQPSVVVRVPVADLSRWRATEPTIATYFLDALMQLAGTRYGREADLVQRSAEERYRELVAKKPRLLETVPLREIASWLGITPIALSRIRKRVKSPDG